MNRMLFGKKIELTPCCYTFLLNYFLAGAILFPLTFYYLKGGGFQLAVFIFLVLFFLLVQSFYMVKYREKAGSHAIWVLISLFSFEVLLIPFLVDQGIVICLSLLAIIPIFAIGLGQIQRLPLSFFITFLVAALAVLVDMVMPWPEIRFKVCCSLIYWGCGGGLLGYTLIVFFIWIKKRKSECGLENLGLNLATQYSLVLIGISTVVIFIVSIVLISQIRASRIAHVGSNFQTVAENYAKWAGSHLEQQVQTLRLLTQQVPAIEESLAVANDQYGGTREEVAKKLQDKNRLWNDSIPMRNNPFVMEYLNSPVVRVLTNFRGHNSFHNDIVLVDSFGGLVASLGKKPQRFYFYDQKWWQLSWNNGLGNIFIGDLEYADKGGDARLRLAIEVIDPTSNKVIGILSSMYILRTLFEDMQRFKPDSVEQISIVDETSRVVASTDPRLKPGTSWSTCSQNGIREKQGAGWLLGNDPWQQDVLVGFAQLSTAYSVISDPLKQLGWTIVVSGTRSNALADVSRSTKMAMFFGLCTLALGVLAAIATARVITRPIENLTQTALSMGDGNLSVRAAYEGPEELVALAESFNRLSSRSHQLIEDLQTQTVQLETARREAEVATRLKGEFLANMSHEIRTPLNAILGFADILEKLISDKVLKNHAGTIKSSGNDLLLLINDILDLSKIEAGHMELVPTATRVRNLCRELHRIFSIGAEKKGIGIEVSISPEIPELLMIDGKRLKQVLFNLIGNAVKFTDKGKVVCDVRGTETTSGTWNLMIDVVDTGVGIDQEYLEKIFESFQQQGEHSSIAAEGTGLGLPITRSLVAMMNGTVTVKSEIGKGSIFSIYVPKIAAVNPDEVNAKEGEEDKEREGGEGKLLFDAAKILLADDLDINRHLIIEMLKDFPFEIVQAVNGLEAVKEIEKNHFDLVMLDIRMPELDGFGALEEIRKKNFVSPLAVVAITSSGMKEEQEMIEQAGFDDYLIRPFKPKALHELIGRNLVAKRIGFDSGALKRADKEQAISEWECPQKAFTYFAGELREQWEEVYKRQSMPEIQKFAKKVIAISDRYNLSVPAKYGEGLETYASAFDIENVEIQLKLFTDLLRNCIIREL